MDAHRYDLELAMAPAKRKREAGLSLIELMFACFILAVGMAGSLAMIVMAISGNNRNKVDSTATMLAQSVIEQMNVRPANSNSLIPMTDCAGNALSIDTTGAANPGAGAALITSATDPLYGRIDWLAASPGAGYSFNYVACDQQQYEVRWNVITVSNNTKLITVSARRSGASRNAQLFAIPAQLRTIAGP